MAIRVGVIGFGLSARVFHIPFLAQSPAFEVVAVSTSRAAEVREMLPEARVFESAESLIADGGVDLVINTAPNDVHYSLSALALSAGKHVVVEKPFVTNIEDGEHLIALAAARGLVLSVFHNRRWDGDFLTCKKLIADGALGQVRFFETHFDRFRPKVRDTWREGDGDGSGILFDLGPHLIDQAVQLFGLPDAITAQVAKMREGARADDFFRLTFHYSGMLAVLVSSPFSAAPNLRFRLEGEAGNYVKYGLDPQEARLRGGTLPAASDWAAEEAGQYGTLYSADGEVSVPTVTGGYQHYFAALARSIQAGAKPPVSPQEALNVMKLIDLARESAATGRTITASSLDA